jgi:tetratricopeptide (TPR) repeat protein
VALPSWVSRSPPRRPSRPEEARAAAPEEARAAEGVVQAPGAEELGPEAGEQGEAEPELGGGGGGGFYHPYQPAPYRAQAPADDLTTCAPGQVWDRKHHRCLQRRSGILPNSELTEYAYALAKANRFQEAIDVLDTLDNPNTPRAINYRGYATRKLGRTDEGIGYYLKAVALDPSYPQVREYLGEAYVIEGKFSPRSSSRRSRRSAARRSASITASSPRRSTTRTRCDEACKGSRGRNLPPARYAPACPRFVMGSQRYASTRSIDGTVDAIGMRAASTALSVCGVRHQSVRVSW